MYFARQESQEFKYEVVCEYDVYYYAEIEETYLRKVYDVAEERVFEPERVEHMKHIREREQTQ